jgi:hypothetical protein
MQIPARFDHFYNAVFTFFTCSSMQPKYAQHVKNALFGTILPGLFLHEMRR